MNKFITILMFQHGAQGVACPLVPMGLNMPLLIMLIANTSATKLLGMTYCRVVYMIWPIRLECNKLYSNARSHHESLSPDILSPVGCGYLETRLQQLSFEFPTCLPQISATSTFCCTYLLLFIQNRDSYIDRITAIPT